LVYSGHILNTIFRAQSPGMEGYGKGRMKNLLLVAGVLLLMSACVNTETIREAKDRSIKDPDYRPVFVSSVSLDPSEVTVADGRTFYHAGYGATTGFDGKRLNYTLKGENKGLVGEFRLDEYGNLFAEYVEFRITEKEGFVKTSSKMLRVKQMKWE